MTERRPLVMVNGRPAELPIGDTIPGSSTGYVHFQLAASNTWVIDHPLDKFPSVSVVDSAGTAWHGEVRYVSRGQIILTFSAGFSGRAFLN